MIEGGGGGGYLKTWVLLSRGLEIIWDKKQFLPNSPPPPPPPPPPPLQLKLWLVPKSGIGYRNQRAILV